MSRRSKQEECKTTLIVVPVSLINQWKQEIEKHVQAKHKLSIFVYYNIGRNKVTFAELAKYDIVITSYGILASEYKQHFLRHHDLKKNPKKLAGQSPFFQIRSIWYRVVLDEAHNINNRNTVTSRACAALETKYRWCMTGTPMQNTVMDLHSLIYFLRIGPYTNTKKFRKEIALPLEKGQGGPSRRVMARLRTLILSIMIRRTKSSLFNGKPILALPPKKIIEIQVDIDEEEKEYYKILENNSAESVVRLAKGGMSHNLMHIFALLTKLRQAADNLKILEKADLDKYKEFQVNRINDHAVKVARNLNTHAVTRLKSLSYYQCPVCLDAVDRDNVVIFWPCGHYTCEECCLMNLQDGNDTETDRILRCPTEKCGLPIDEKDIFSYIVFRWIYIRNMTNDQIRQNRESYRVLKKISKTRDNRHQGQEKPFENSSFDIKDETKSFLIPLDDLDQPEQQKATAADSFCINNKEIEFPLPPFTLSAESKFARDGPLVGPLLSKNNDWEQVYPRGWFKSSKVIKCMDVLRDIFSEKKENKVIIFSSFLGMLGSVELSLKMDFPSISYDRYDGKTNFDMRTKIIDDFQGKLNPQILLVSLKAGNSGLNLTAAANVIFLDPFWNPYVEDQAMDRVHRFGQMSPVTIYRLSTPNTVEDRVLYLQKRKRAIIDTALDEGEIKRLSRLTPAEIFFLFGLGN